ncbi:MAG: response regulator [Planctomycetota bacterium]
MGHAELARDELTDHPSVDPETRANLEEILRSGHRASELTAQLLAFGRRQDLRPRRLEPNRVIGSMERMLERLVREDIELHLELAPDAGVIEVDGGQLEQVLLNFVVNAVDAMPKGGDLVLSTARRDVSEAEAARRPGARPGPHCEIAIRDSGVGMDERTRQRVFEPFFTTKASGKGTGLGLATALGIIQQSGGHVLVDSGLGRGTTFRALFPLAGRGAGPAEVEEPGEAGEVRGGTERILLVDDDPGVRAAGARALEAHGYRVRQAGDPGRALELAGEDGPFDLVVTDVVLPELDGRELAERLRRDAPGLRVLYTSGYTSDVVSERGVPEHGEDFLRKPYGTRALLAKVRALLDA